jgi:hypothetical protein
MRADSSNRYDVIEDPGNTIARGRPTPAQEFKYPVTIFFSWKIER